MSVLLVIGAGVESVPSISKAKAMGHFVVACDGDAAAPGFSNSDYTLVVSTYDVTALIAAAKNFEVTTTKIDGVISFGCDVPLSISSLASALGLQGISMQTALLAIDKVAMKSRLEENDIPVPWYREIFNVQELKSAVKDTSGCLVIKPVDSRGARGVLRLMPEDDLDWAFNHARKFSPTRRVMIEEFIDGPQVSTEGVIIDNVGYPVVASDRNYPNFVESHPFMIEDGGGFPTELSKENKTAIELLSLEAGKSLGVENGIIKGDMVLSSEGPKVIEVAPRLSGGWLSSDQVPLGLGIDLVEIAIDISLGNRIEVERLKATKEVGVAIRFFFPKPGCLEAVTESLSLEDCDWLYKRQYYVGPGDTIVRPQNHTQRAGFVITTGDSAREARERAEFAIESTRFHYKIS